MSLVDNLQGAVRRCTEWHAEPDSLWRAFTPQVVTWQVDNCSDPLGRVANAGKWSKGAPWKLPRVLVGKGLPGTKTAAQGRALLLAPRVAPGAAAGHKSGRAAHGAARARPRTAPE